MYMACRAHAVLKNSAACRSITSSRGTHRRSSNGAAIISIGRLRILTVWRILWFMAAENDTTFKGNLAQFYGDQP